MYTHFVHFNAYMCACMFLCKCVSERDLTASQVGFKENWNDMHLKNEDRPLSNVAKPSRSGNDTVV